MNNKIKFTNEEEEAIINFVQQNEILYNVKHANFRDTEAKNRIWLHLSEQLDKDVDIIKKKWASMRDYFCRKYKTTTPGQAAESGHSKRDAHLAFLLDTSIMQQKRLSNIDIDVDVDVDYDYDSVIEQNFNMDTSISDTSTMNGGETTKKIKKEGGNPDLIQALLNRPRPDPLALLPPPPPPPKDHLDHFFASLGSTMRTLPPVMIAQLKINMMQMVSQAEIEMLQTFDQNNDHDAQNNNDQNNDTTNY